MEIGRVVNIFFDVDGTLCSMNDGILRPGARELVRDLTMAGHKIYIWSGVGLRWTDVRRWQLDEYIVDCLRKPIFDYRVRLRDFVEGVTPDFVVDDHAGVVEAFGGYRARSAYYHDDADDEISNVSQAIDDWLAGLPLSLAREDTWSG